jgi:hypothetical protein
LDFAPLSLLIESLLTASFWQMGCLIFKGFKTHDPLNQSSVRWIRWQNQAKKKPRLDFSKRGFSVIGL